MIELEYELEKSLRAGIRKSLSEAAAVTPALAFARIIGSWLEAETDDEEGQNVHGLCVLLFTAPNTSEGYNPDSGLDPIRSSVVSVSIISQPDNDEDRKIKRAFYNAVRRVFETVPPMFSLPEGIEFGGVLIANAGSALIENLGDISTFDADMRVSLIETQGEEP